MHTLPLGQTQKRDLSGQQLKSYNLLELIGEGGFGAVYRAYQPVVDRSVAVKVILPDYANQPEFIRRFDVEAQLVARLEHMNIVPLYDYWRDPAGAYLVMRLMRGGSLRSSLIRGKTWELVEIARLLDQISSALSVAHRNNVVHRDLKPDNILLDEDNNAYLTDFGIAKDITTISPVDEPIIGSPDYIAPEQIRREPISIKTDIYSLGVVLYELLTGKAPFDAPSDTQLLRQHIHTPLPPLQSIRPDLPVSLNNVLRQATAKSPDARYPDALSLATDFRQSLGLNILEDSTGQTGSSHTRATVRRSETLLVRDTRTLQPENPYKGLKPFQEADAADFFGREALVKQLLDELREPIPFLAVVGPSGSGKSSVVKAGLIPALRQGMIAGSQNWFIAQMTPGSRPFEELEAALLRIAANNPGSLMATLKSSERGLMRAVIDIMPQHNSQIVLFIDQFEEIFTLVEDEAERALFLNSLYYAMTAIDAPLRVVVTLRADFYDRPLLYGGIGQLVRSYTEVVLPLSPEEMEQAIIKPAERSGLLYEPELITAIIADVNKQPGSLPLLQYALTELFEKRQGIELMLESYHAIGGVSGALAKRADELYETLDIDGKEAVRQIFLRLVTLGEGTEDTRRRVLLSELIATQDDRQGGTPIRDVIDLFGKFRLLTFDHEKQTRAPTVEVAHEALIQKWGLLRDWLDNSRDELRIQRRLAAATQDWLNAKRDSSYLATGDRLTQFESLSRMTTIALNKDETAYLSASIQGRKRAAARLRLFIATLVIFSLVALGLAALAFDRQNSATYEATIARSRELAVTALLNQGQLDRALLLGVEALRTANTFEARNSLLTALQSNPAIVTFVSGDGVPVRSLAYSPDGSLIAYGNRDGTIRFIDGLSRQPTEIALEGHTAPINALVFSPDGQILASGGSDATVRLWDVKTGQPIGGPLQSHADAIWGIAFSADGEMLASAGGGTIQRWDVSEGQPIGDPLQSHDGIVLTVIFSQDGQTIISGGDDHLLRLWNAETGELLDEPLEEHPDDVFTLALSPDGSYLASGDAAHNIILWDASSYQPLAQWDTEQTDYIRKLVFNADGSLLVSASDDGTLKVWDMFSGEQVGNTLAGHQGAVWGAVFDPAGQTLVSASTDGYLIFWNPLAQITLGQPLAEHPETVLDIIFSPDSRWIISGTGNTQPSTQVVDNAVRVWDTESGEMVSEFHGHNGAVTAVSISPDGKRIASASLDLTVMISDPVTGEMIGDPLEGHTRAVYGLAFSPDGQFLASGGEGGRVFLWDMTAEQSTGRLIVDSGSKVWALAFSPDSKILAGGLDGGVLQLWNVETAEAVGEPLTRHNDAVVTLAFSSDGQTLATGSWDNSVILWDTDTWQPRGEPITSTDWVSGVAFSPDNQTLAYSSFNQTISLWDIPTNQSIGQPLIGHQDAATDVAFSRSGLLASASADRSIILWDVAPAVWQTMACQIANRSLTPEEWQQFFGSEAYRQTCP
jgi:WD40 repeat protein/serine/threonine protein kinase